MTSEKAPKARTHVSPNKLFVSRFWPSGRDRFRFGGDITRLLRMRSSS